MAPVCKELLNTGACSKTSCNDLHFCKPCSVVATSTDVLQKHLSGKRHRRTIDGTDVLVHCPICQANVTGWTVHVRSVQHRKLATHHGVNPTAVQPGEPVPTPGSTYCNPCKTFVPEPMLKKHRATVGHKAKQTFTTYEAASEEAEQDKHGITVSHADIGLDFGVVDPADARNGVASEIIVQNAVPLANVTLLEAKFASIMGVGSTSKYTVSSESFGKKVVSGVNMSLAVTLKQVNMGRYEDRLEVVFMNMTSKQRFSIVRSVRATVGSKADHDALKPAAPFIPRKRTTRQPEKEVVPGDPPASKSAIPYVGKLPRCPIPERLATALANSSVSHAINFFRKSVLPRTLNCKTHGQHFKALIWAEEHRAELDLATYDMAGVTLQKRGQYFYLQVRGLAEKRPSVMIGDRIMIHPQGSPEGKWYEGYAHFVRGEEVGLSLRYSGHTASKLYDIRFKLNRITICREHQALNVAICPDRLLFPEAKHSLLTSAPSPATIKARIYNPLLKNNPAQLQVVASIVSMPPGSVPFIVFGPPGTGKTVTIVESILQLLRNQKTRVLACAPSNSAADLIATHLMSKLSTSELFRFNAPSRQKDQVSDALRGYSYTTDADLFSLPPMADVKRYRVIVATCVSAGFAFGVGLPRGHFSHIFVDEAGQASEPEVMIAVKTASNERTNVVLSGDPKQLGPVVRSPVARALGLELSYLERLTQRPPYDIQGGHGKTIVKLVQNFRSHESILRFPNERFYGGELRPCAPTKTANAYINSSHLVAKRFPVVVHAISGSDLREATSPSYFNIDEATQVKAYVEALRADKKVRITDDDIGVIAPYNAQCRKIRALLKPVAGNVKVGSVEEFQGQERRVIIISTVRSNRELVQYDLKHTLGFVASPRRFNVAVTRAQALLIVVGDPEVLCLDPLWRAFLNYAYINGGWRGHPPSWDTSAPVDDAADFFAEARDARVANMDEFTRRMETLTLEGLAEESDDGDADANVDRPWQEEE